MAVVPARRQPPTNTRSAGRSKKSQTKSQWAPISSHPQGRPAINLQVRARQAISSNSPDIPDTEPASRMAAQPTLNTRSMTSAPVAITGRNSLRYTVSVVDVVLCPTR
jgi:hypothetical protein